jgi:mannosyl-oligosaccharide alpha-1,2-mannosidase
MQGDEEAPSKKNDQHQVEITVGSTSTTAASKQAKKRTARIGAGPMLFDEEPYSPSTKYNLGTHTPSSTFFSYWGQFTRRNRVPLILISTFIGILLLYSFIFFLDSEYDDDSKKVIGEKIVFAVDPEPKMDINANNNNYYNKPKVKRLVTIDDYKKSFEMDNDPVNMERRARVREAMKHAYSNYANLVWGRDELKPISRSFHNWVVNGMGMTTLDSLDTLFIMGLKDEFERATRYVDKEMPNFGDLNSPVSVFETTIRVLGGLLAAYDLSQDKVFLEKARSIGDGLLPAFDSATGIPYAQINLRTGQKNNFHWNGGCSVLSEFGTLQLEFRRLTEVTGDPKYDRAVTKVMDVMETQSKSLVKPGLYPVNFNPDSGAWCNDHITLGAYGDSHYEYLLKQWIMSDGKLERYRNMFEQSARGIIDHLLVKPPKNWYIAEMRGGQRVNKIDHLVCFASGMFALAHATNATKSLNKNQYNVLEVAKQFAETCYNSYITTASGLGPETFSVDERSGTIIPGVRTYLLRPETVESLFILYRVTGDEMYRDWGWKLFESMEAHCRVQFGYSGIRDVTAVPVIHDDFQQSFFLAETLKYLYLLFSPTNVIPLNEFVFNTEAHPFKITHQ